MSLRKPHKQKNLWRFNSVCLQEKPSQFSDVTKTLTPNITRRKEVNKTSSLDETQRASSMPFIFNVFKPSTTTDKNSNKLKKLNPHFGVISRGLAATMTPAYVTVTRAPEHRTVTGCINLPMHKNSVMDYLGDLGDISENDLLLLVVQGRFPHNDLKLFDESWIVSESPNDVIGSHCAENNTNSSIMRTAFAVVADSASGGDAELSEADKQTESNVKANEQFLLSPLVQEKFKKMSRRRQSAPSAVLRNVLRSSKFGSRRSIENTSGLFKDEAKVDCLPFTIKPSFGEQILNGGCNRQYIREGRVQLAFGAQTQERYMFLFSDILLLSKLKSGSNHKLKNRIRLNEMWLSEDCNNEVGEVAKTTDCSFVIGWPTTNVVATFSSPEIKQLWFNDLNRLILLAREDETLKHCTIKVTNQVTTSRSAVVKSINVNNEESVRDFLDTTVLALQLEGSTDDYQLWVSTGKDPTSYPLIGHERPHAIRMSCVRDAISANHGHTGDNIDYNILRNVSNEDLSPRFDCNFMLLKRNTTPFKFQYEHSQRRISRLKSKTQIFSFNWGRKRSEDLSRTTCARHPSSDAPSSGTCESCGSSALQSPTSLSDPNSPKLFGVPLNVICEEGQIPAPIMTMLKVLYRKAPTTNGIFRKSANVKNVKLTKKKISEDFEFDFSDIQIHVMAALLKDFLRSIPESLLRYKMHTQWVDAMKEDDDEDKIQSLVSLIDTLDEVNRSLLTYLMFVMNHISLNHEENNMTAFNLAVCVAPSLLWSPVDSDISMQTELSKKVSELVEFMTINFDKIFDSTSCEIFKSLPNGEEENSEQEDDLTTKKEEISESETTGSGFDDITSDEEKITEFDRSNSTRIQIRKRLFMNTEITASMDSLDHDIIEAQLVIRQASRDLEVSLSKLGEQNCEKLKSKSSSRYDVCSLSNDSGFTTLSGDDEDGIKINKFSLDKANMSDGRLTPGSNENKNNNTGKNMYAEDYLSDENLNTTKERQRRLSEPPLHYKYAITPTEPPQLIQESFTLEDNSSCSKRALKFLYKGRKERENSFNSVGAQNSNCNNNNVKNIDLTNVLDMGSENILAQEYLRKLRETSTDDFLSEHNNTDVVKDIINNSPLIKRSSPKSEEEKPTRRVRRRSSRRSSRNAAILTEKKHSLNSPEDTASKIIKTTDLVSFEQIEPRGKFSGMHKIKASGLFKEGQHGFSSSLPIQVSAMRETQIGDIDENKNGSSCENFLTSNGSAFTRRFQSSCSQARSSSFDCFNRSMSSPVREKNDSQDNCSIYNDRASFCEKHKRQSVTTDNISVHKTLMQQQNFTRKNSMPASFVNLDSLLEKMNQTFDTQNNLRPQISQQTYFKTGKPRVRKENVLTRPGALRAVPFNQFAEDNVNSYGYENLPEENNNNTRTRRSSKLNDVDLFNLSESLAFGNRKSARNLTPVTTPILKRAVSYDVDNLSRKHPEKTNSPSMRTRRSLKSNPRHSLSDNKHDSRQFKFYGFKELANAEESYV